MSRRHHFGAPHADGHRPHSQSGPHHKGNAFEPLPTPTGSAPYRLDLGAVLPDRVAKMNTTHGMTLHMVGDTGGVLDPRPQELVATGMATDAAVAGRYGTPAFFYHLGDVIYFDGEIDRYYAQFYQPYEYYPAPIIGIPGNHDGDRYDRGRLVDTAPSLEGFVRNFCQAEAGIHQPEAREAPRTAMIQPNVYFTLNTPFATFIGLYTNVPEGGEVKQDQRDWFAGELQAAPDDRPVIVAMHHPIHSLDAFHSGSRAMADVLAEAETQSGRSPHLVVAGHVHNYQRFSVTDATGGITPFVVAGFGGYHNLHRMIRPNGEDLMTPYAAPNDPNVVLDAYVDDRFGFLRIEIDKDTVTLSALTVPRPHESYRGVPRLRDRLRYDWQRRVIVS